MQNTRLPEDLKTRVIELYTLEGLGGTAIARELCIGTSSVYRILKSAGVVRDGTAVRNNRFRLSTEEIANAIEKYKTGVSVSDLALEFNCSNWCISHALKRYGVEVRGRGAVGKTLAREVAEDLVSRYGHGESQTSLARSIGCSQSIMSRILRGLGVEPRRKHLFGEGHGSWKGGRSITSGGYVQILLQPDSPYWQMRGSNGYVLEHRLVMARHLGRLLTSLETVHHKNGDKQDNAIDNLQLRVGKHGIGEVWCCADCGSHNLKPLSI